MYHEHFGLQSHPFKNTPDTRLFYAGGKRGAVLDALEYAVRNGEGIIKVVGEVGSGKTMLCRMLQTRLAGQVETVFLANPSLTPDNIFHAIAVELHIELPARADRFHVMQALQTFLLKKHAAGKQVVILVEEAQGMPLATLEEIRLLSNLETKSSKLLQLVLFGQPELDTNLSVPGIRQLKERISYQFTLSPLTRAEVREYLIFRLRGAGYRGPTVFHPRAAKRIWLLSSGLTRRINLLADKALLATFIEKKDQVLASHVNKAASDSAFMPVRDWRRTAAYLALFLAVSLPAAAWFGFRMATTSTAKVFLPQNGVAAPVTAAKPSPPSVSSAPASPQKDPESVTRVTDPVAIKPSAKIRADPVAKREAPSTVKTVAMVDGQPTQQTDERVVVPTPLAKPADTKGLVLPRDITQHNPPSPAQQKTPTVIGSHAKGKSSKLEVFLSERLKATEQWLADPGSVNQLTIQLMLMSLADNRWLVDLVDYQKAHQVVFFIKFTTYQNRPYYIVYMNRYDSWSVAQKDLHNLPPLFSQHHPYLQSVRRILQNR